MCSTLKGNLAAWHCRLTRSWQLILMVTYQIYYILPIKIIRLRIFTYTVLLSVFRVEEDEEEEEIVHMGNAIMSFYSALIDLLGRCAPEPHVSNTKTEK